MKTVQSVPLIKPHLGLSSSSNKDNNNSNIPSSSTSATGLVDWTAIIKRLEDSAREAEAAFLVDRRAMKQTDAAATEEGGSIGGGGRRRGRGKHLLQAKEAEDEEEYAEDYDDDDDDGDNDDDDDEQEGRDEDNLEYGAKSQKDTIPTNQQNNHSHQPLVREDIITIGMVGHPNVGKSSLINSLISRKVVSTSKTPGHTKHLQTIFLTRQIRLADCPGIVFPSFLPRPLQVIREREGWKVLPDDVFQQVSLLFCDFRFFLECIKYHKSENHIRPCNF